MVSAWMGSICLFTVSILYVLLALGLSYGEFAMGGKYKRLPKQMRIATALSILVQWTALLFLLQMGNIIYVDFLAPMAKGVCYSFAVYLFFNTIMNAFSISKKEKMIMTPLSFITAICFLLTALNG
ncbi:hypothetical protein J0K78_04215 [Halobacillus sp. GSS1]|uniref:hypothetical protein n=1 Tax=Halobacillus sp. GSS1 TaxID=2815919 RepID=UPI001A8E4D8F|nr:hypothetical protein [Halobacillus sp. GSS1]